jgi:hypothetical protein
VFDVGDRRLENERVKLWFYSLPFYDYYVYKWEILGGVSILSILIFNIFILIK